MVVVTLGGRRACGELDWLYRRHSREVQRYVQRVLRSNVDAEDVVQATFVRAFRALDRGEQVERPRNWLIKIAHNECRRFLASRRVHLELPDELAAEPLPASRAGELSRAMRVLAPAQREALVLRELEGRSYAEIAEAMSLSESAVETLLFRARRAVREQLELAVSCEEFPALLESGERARVRAHVRVCEPCAKLERQARGRKSRLSRIASSFFLPKFVAGFLATGATVAIVAAPHSAPAPVRDVPPLQVDKPARTWLPAKAGNQVGLNAPKPAGHRVTATEPTIPPGPEPLPVPEPTEPGPPPVPAPPTHSAPSPQPEPAPQPTPEPTPVPAPVLPLPPAATELVAPVVAPVVDTVTTVTTAVEAPVQAVVEAVVPPAPALPALPNVSAP